MKKNNLFTNIILYNLMIACSLLFSCKSGIPSVGVIKNISAGLTAHYKNLKPEKIYLTMNSEEINHTDIPLGESFLVINEGINGFQERNGKVSVGCALVIKDKQGNKLLNEKDLYELHDVYDKDSINFLRCTVSTGAPMKWEETYEVVVTFWDKYGDGKIENNLSIRCIDIP